MTAITFTPDRSSSCYEACAEEAEGFPTDPAGGTTVLLGDDAFEVITLTG